MGDCFTHCMPSLRSCKSGALPKQDKIVKVVMLNGKIVEFGRPTVVKDILMQFSASGIGISKESSEHLPPDYKLKRGKLYYLLPSVSSAGPETSCSSNREQAGGIKRIKVVLTKQQLQELVTEKISLEDILLQSQVQSISCHSVDLPTNWKPKLDSIPE
ncbi:hypothetical protein O6P43_019998 [Quillaja saponaria]|uniref:Uncharacterized protein n=1 Tax=Quillaja saponaria TaxID=32244 RepID=A0AAD7LJP6_QUISA|nr:hypothetical protein O6P43_019998 [Quillaja saponaria]